MKSLALRRFGLGLVVAAGAMVPMAALSAESPKWSYDDHAFYDNLKGLQTEASMKGADTTRGAQGPVRTDFMDPIWSYDDNAFYDNLKHLQSATSMTDSSTTSRNMQ